MKDFFLYQNGRSCHRSSLPFPSAVEVTELVLSVCVSDIVSALTAEPLTAFPICLIYTKQNIGQSWSNWVKLSNGAMLTSSKHQFDQPQPISNTFLF